MKIKRLIAAILCVVMAFSFAACTKENTEPEDPGDIGALTPNPLTESTKEGILDEYGFTFALPEGAEEVSYWVIKGEDEASPIVECRFVSDGVSCRYRLQSQQSVELTDISGMNYEWTNDKPVEVSYCEGIARWIDSEQGICFFFDLVMGVGFCVSMDSGASEQALLAHADTLFSEYKNEN